MTMYMPPAQAAPNNQSAAYMLSGLNDYNAPVSPPPQEGGNSYAQPLQAPADWNQAYNNANNAYASLTANNTPPQGPNSGGYDYNNNPAQYTGFAQNQFNPINAPLNMGQAYNQSIDLAKQYKAAGNPWNEQGLQYVFGQMGLPTPVANQMWQDAQAQGFPSEQTWANDLQGAVNQYNQQGQQGPPSWMGQGGGIPPQLQQYLQQQGWTAPASGGNAPGGQGALPSWMSSWLTQNGWTAPQGAGQASGLPAQNPGQSPVSQGAPPWAQSLAGGYALPAFTGQGSLPFASAQQWNNYMPQEQQAILGAGQSVGIDPQAYQQQMFAGFPEWGGIGQAGWQS